jgi:uncharacterized protein
MALTDLINEDIKKAMLAREKDKLEALRAIKSALLLEATKDGSATVSDEAANKLLQRLYKQRNESAEIYVAQGREDLAKVEIDQAAVIKAYLPEQMSEEQITTELKRIIVELGASSPADLGKVMGVATKALAGKADGKLVSAIVKGLLS